MTPHYPGAAEMLRALRAEGKRLFVVSNKPRHISMKVLEAEGTLGLFDEVVTQGLAGAGVCGQAGDVGSTCCESGR
jgi:phosphoglycolate phosphatase-like HAD superfamily hydrolase